MTIQYLPPGLHWYSDRPRRQCKIHPDKLTEMYVISGNLISDQKIKKVRKIKGLNERKNW